MPSLVNPMDALRTFEPALRRGELDVQRGVVDPSLMIHMDMPQGIWRITYAKLRDNAVIGIAIIIPADHEKGLPVFQIGYAVPQQLRKRGIAKELARSAIEEFSAGMARNGIVHFFLEAMVGVKNVASQKVAQDVIGGEPRPTIDSNSGEEILQYLKEVGHGINKRPPSM